MRYEVLTRNRRPETRHEVITISKKHHHPDLVEAGMVEALLRKGCTTEASLKIGQANGDVLTVIVVSFSFYQIDHMYNLQLQRFGITARLVVYRTTIISLQSLYSLFFGPFFLILIEFGERREVCCASAG
jgi:hypothetical protein